MTRIRTVKPEFYRNHKLFLAEQETGLPLFRAFSGMWCCCDREGRFKWRPEELKLDVLPYDEIDFSLVLDALWTRGYFVKYRVGSEIFGWVPTWYEHQVINNRESASKIPDVSMADEVIVASTTRESRDTELHEGKGTGRELEGKGTGRELARVGEVPTNTLFTVLRLSFQSKNPMWPKPAKEIEDLNWLVEAITCAAPDDTMRKAEALVLKFWDLTQNGRDFWKRQPFYPSMMRSLWGFLLKELQNAEGSSVDLNDVSWMEDHHD